MEELSKLSKGVIKYPGAALNRWKLITEFIGTDKTQKQVIAKAQELAQKQSISKGGANVANVVQSSTFAERVKKQKADEAADGTPVTPKTPSTPAS